MTTFTVSEDVRKQALRSSRLMLFIGLTVTALGGWLLFGGNFYSIIGGVLGVCLGLFVVYAAIKTTSTVKNTHPLITVDEDGLEVSGEKDSASNKRIFWSQVRSAKVIHLSTAPYLELWDKNGEKLTAGYRFDDFDEMAALVRANLERFGIELDDEIAAEPTG